MNRPLREKIDLRVLGILLAMGVAASSVADLVMDQLPRSLGESPAGKASQVFEPQFGQYTISYIDDFSVTPLQLQLVQVAAHMIGFGLFEESHWLDPDIVRGFRVSVYTSVSNAAAAVSLVESDVAHGDATLEPGFGNLDRIVTIPVQLPLPEAGTYWIGVQGLMDYAAGGQIGVRDSTRSDGTPGGTNAWHVNPGGGFGFPDDMQQAAVDAAYRVEAVPEPAAWAILVPGAAALLIRRARRRGRPEFARTR